MTGRSYDIVTVGGGIAGATLAKLMAEQGVNVLVLGRKGNSASTSAEAITT
jgi:choline dehydrogenase-like flavoprotein